ncbi:MAG: hypothetical protein IIC35_05190 [Gemmatimonadetes bacterium]|nr:hypothetical protein [Gemmatimonadota bacterium]
MGDLVHAVKTRTAAVIVDKLVRDIWIKRNPRAYLSALGISGRDPNARDVGSSEVRVASIRQTCDGRHQSASRFPLGWEERADDRTFAHASFMGVGSVNLASLRELVATPSHHHDVMVVLDPVELRDHQAAGFGLDPRTLPGGDSMRF